MSLLMINFPVFTKREMSENFLEVAKEIELAICTYLYVYYIKYWSDSVPFFLSISIYMYIYCRKMLKYSNDQKRLVDTKLQTLVVVLNAAEFGIVVDMLYNSNFA